jgi:hypothetical protein
VLAVVLLIALAVLSSCASLRGEPGTSGEYFDGEAAEAVEATVLIEPDVLPRPDGEPADIDAERLRAITRRRLEDAGFSVTQPAELLVRIYAGRYPAPGGGQYARIDVHAYRWVPNEFRPDLVWGVWLQERVSSGGADASGGTSADGEAGGAPDGDAAAGAGLPGPEDYERVLRRVLDTERLREFRVGGETE